MFALARDVLRQEIGRFLIHQFLYFGELLGQYAVIVADEL
jgi:hypothetical protein